MDKVDSILNSYADNNLFKNKIVVQSNYLPEAVLHRADQVEAIASILAPALRGEKVSNLFLYGRTGSGKTLSVQHVGGKLLEKVKQIGQDNLKFIYVNCKLKKVADTEYRIIAEIIKALKGSVPATGLPTDVVYSKFIELIDNEKKLIVIIFDEIDHAVNKISDNFLYNLTRLNSELKNCEMAFIGISNDLTFTENMDPRVKSSLSEEELVFPPYNAIQLQDILKERANLAFRKNVIEEGAIEKCAAYAAREHGDARRALELLRVSGELAERDNQLKVSIKYIDDAENKIERDRILDIIKTQPKQQQLTTYSILEFHNKGKKIFTGEIYGYYLDLCRRVGLKPLTQRRISDIIAELDMLGIINSKVISKGRYGRTREIQVTIPSSNLTKIEEALKEGLGL